MARAPVELTPAVWRLPTVGASAVNSFAFIDPDGSVTLLDTGLGPAPGRLLRQLQLMGKAPADVKRIIISHAHSDHAGGLRRMQRATAAPVAAHHDDAEAIRSGRVPPRDRSLPLARVLGFMSRGFPACAVDETFADGDLLDVAGGLEVIHTPGHTPGHCSFLHRGSGILITGDALFNLRNRIAWSYAAFCSDFRQSKQTAERLGEASYDVAAFTHGPEIRDNARAAVREFLRRRASG